MPPGRLRSPEVSLSPAFLDELRARTLLSALVGKTVKLTRAGREWRACCPFHDEKSASFTVSDEKGFYHCFGCGAHGGAIDWVMETEGLGFVEAVARLLGGELVEDRSTLRAAPVSQRPLDLLLR